MNIMKKIKLKAKYYIYFHLINILIFLLCCYLENYIFNRSYIFTSVIFGFFFSLIKVYFTRKRTFHYFFITFFKYLLCLILLLFSFFIIVSITNNEILHYLLMFFLYLLVVYINIYQTSFLKFNFKDLLFQFFVFAFILTTYNYLGNFKFDFGIPYLFSFWIFFMLFF